MGQVQIRQTLLSFIFLIVLWDDKTHFTESFTATIHSGKSRSYSNCVSMSSAADATSSSQPQTKEKMEEAKRLISKAISIGAPAYNAGDIVKCAQVYKDTAMEISSLLPKNLQRDLEQTIETNSEDANEQAWAFRRQFDSIMDYSPPFQPSIDNNSNSKMTLEAFSNTMIPKQPLLVNDNVMGGISQGEWVPDTQTFRGNTSLAYNGGFASLRWRLERIQNWSYAKGIYLKIQHSNPQQHTFRLILKDTTCEQVRGANFKTTFANPHDFSKIDDHIIYIPFSAFDQIEQMGRAFPNGPIFNPAAVTEIGLMAIKPTVVGEFELRIQEWGLYSTTTTSSNDD
jgi:hypothetical protein